MARFTWKVQYSSSIFASASMNFRPQVHSLKHRDLPNLPFGWCGIQVTALVDFDLMRAAASLFKIWSLLLSFPMALKETRLEMRIGLYPKLPGLLKSTYNACNDIILKTYLFLHHLQARCHTNITFIHSCQSSFLNFYIPWRQQLSSRTNACRLINVTWGCYIPIDIKIAFSQASQKLKNRLL